MTAARARDVREDLSADREGHGEDEPHEEGHLRHEEHEDLWPSVSRQAHQGGGHGRARPTRV